MTRDDIVTNIKRRLSFRHTGDAHIAAELVNAQNELEEMSQLPWFLLEEEASVGLSAGDGTAALPEGFIREPDEQETQFYLDSDGLKVFLKKDTYTYLSQWYKTAEDGYPVSYAVRSTTLEFFPAPVSDMTVYFTYFKRASELADDNLTNVWTTNAPFVLQGKAGMMIAVALKNADAFASFKDEHDRALERMWRMHEDREFAGEALHMGGTP